MLIVASKTIERCERDGVLQHSTIPHARAPVVDCPKVIVVVNPRTDAVTSVVMVVHKCERSNVSDE